MNTIIERFEKIKSKIVSIKPVKPVNIIAVSKTFTLDYIKPLLDYGHTDFGESSSRLRLRRIKASLVTVGVI